MPMSGHEFVEWLDHELEPLRREVIASPYYEAWCSGKLSKEQLFQIMGQWYAYLKHIPSILCSWIQRCPDPDLGLKYIAYTHEEAPHPEYLTEFAKEIGRDPEEMRRLELIPEFTTPYFYYWLSRGHIVEIAAANNFGNERTNTRAGTRMYEAAKNITPTRHCCAFTASTPRRKTTMPIWALMCSKIMQPLTNCSKRRRRPQKNLCSLKSSVPTVSITVS